MDVPPKIRWEFYVTRAGAPVVSKEVGEAIGGKPPRVELSRLMWRIQHRCALPRDTKHLGGGLWEARLSYATNEYRLYYAPLQGGKSVLLGLKFHKKGGQGAQQRGIAVARERLADWNGRI
jgi:phage-related protein